MHGRRRVLALLATIAIGWASAGALRAIAQPPTGQPEPTADALRAIVGAAHIDGMRWPRFPDYQRILEALYGPRSYAPLWLDAGQPTPQAREAIAVLLEAGAKGLDPRDYDAEKLDQASRTLGASASTQEQARFDAMLSVGLLRNISDLHIGRVNPKHLAFGFDIDPKKYDLAALVAGAVRDGRVREVVKQAEPHFPQNRLLEEQLARYREIAADPSLAPVQIAAPSKPGAPLASAPELARWLAALGDMPASAAPSPGVYDGPLVEGVKHFQARHGLAPDGVIGKGTARELAVPASRRVEQIELALERLRWIPALESGRAVFVNVPAFELLAFDDIAADQRPSVQMIVVVGRALRHETPIFTGAMKTVVFAPYWNVPRSITRNEILPKLRKNPGYLAAQQMEIVSGGQVLPPTAASIEKLTSGAAQLRQRPGPKNALGRVKFLFPNSNNVYLHDTPSQAPFAEARRDFSHGCIRLSQPAALAEWVLRGAPGWDADRVAREMVRSSELAVPVQPPVPVVIYYTTALARRDGTIAFFDDVYGLDARLERALARGYPYPP